MLHMPWLDSCSVELTTGLAGYLTRTRYRSRMRFQLFHPVCAACQDVIYVPHFYFQIATDNIIALMFVSCTTFINNHISPARLLTIIIFFT